ncbi:MAG TPA: hypothetical protein VIE46_03660 [Gemmatimonadales bacterium]|jgi:hypothetical protein
MDQAVRSHRLSKAISGTEFFALGFGTVKAGPARAPALAGPW